MKFEQKKGGLQEQYELSKRWRWQKDSMAIIPVFDENNDILRYNVFHVEL